MPGYLVPPTKNPGDVLTSALWNSYIRDNLDFGMVRPIADVVLLSSAASIDLTSIPATFAHLRLELYARGDTASSTTALNLRFNNDATAQYQHQWLYASATTPAALEALAQTSLGLGNIPANTAGANMFGGCVLDIPHYANAANMKNVDALNGYRTGTATGTGTTLRSSGWWNGAAINRITLFPAAGNFVAGTRVTLYGKGGI